MMNKKKSAFKLIKDEAERHFKLGNYSLSKSLEMEYLSAFPEDARSWANAGLCAYNLDQWKEAFEYYRYALQLNKNIPEVWANLGVLAYQLFDEELVEYFELRVKALTLNPFNGNQDPEFKNLLSDLTANNISAFNEILEEDQYNIGARINRGRIWMKLGNYDNAKTDFDEVIYQSPRNSLAHYNLGCLYRNHLNDQKSAKQHFIEAFKYGASDAYFRLFEIEKGFDYLGKEWDVRRVLVPPSWEDDLPF